MMNTSISLFILGAPKCGTTYLACSLHNLGVHDDGREDFPPANEASGHRSRMLQKALLLGGRLRVALGVKRAFGLARLNEQAQAKQALSPQFLGEPEAAFADKRALQDQLGAKAADGAANAHPSAADEKVQP